MTSNYQEIYSRFLAKIKDYDFLNYTEADANESMRGWLSSSLSQPYVYRIFSTFEPDDEIANMVYTLKSTVNDYADKNFVEELLSYQMICEWLRPKVQSTTTLHQMITNSKEQKFYSQQQHLQQLRETLADAEHKVRSMLRDRGYVYNSYLGNAQ